MSPQYHHEQWLSYTWRKAERVYYVSLEQNLFGAWILIRHWGVNDSRRGRSMECTLNTYDEGLQQLAQVRKRRKHRGYVLQEQGLNENSTASPAPAKAEATPW